MEQDAQLFDLMTQGIAVCRVAIEDNQGLLATLFLAGLVGSATHCVGMCGPFVLAQTVARLESLGAKQMREFHRLAGAALVPYHLGRTTTYMGLGAGAAGLAAGLVDLTGLRQLSALLLAVAAVFFLGYGLQRLGVALPFLAKGGEGWWQRTVGRATKPLFSRPVGLRGYGLGLALGFIPCGLLYGALAAAASSGSVVGGAFAMLAFAAGTVPALLAVGLAGHVAGSHWREATNKVAPALLMLNAVILSYMAWQMAA